MNDALDRLTGVGFDQVGGFPSHATMGAEALAALGCYDQVAGWVEWNKGYRAYNDQPVPTAVIVADDEDDWRPALGASRRAADWTALFEREIAGHGWRGALATWWLRLLPGMIGGLTHGLIRTAHAVRGVAAGQPPSALQLRELAHGLGFWAALFTPLAGGPDSAGLAGRPLPPGEVQTALSDLTSSYAGTYAASRPRHPVPLVHTITAPAAVRLVLPNVPADSHDASYRAVAQVARTVAGRFAGPSPQPRPSARGAGARGSHAGDAQSRGGRGQRRACDQAGRGGRTRICATARQVLPGRLADAHPADQGRSPAGPRTRHVTVKAAARI